MEVTFTGSWYDETAEKEAANKLIANGCKLISQHADSMGAPTACETAGVPNVSYNGSTIAACPNTFIVSSRIDWAPYYEYVINAVVKRRGHRRRLDRHSCNRLRRPDRGQRGCRSCRHRRGHRRSQGRSRGRQPSMCSTPPPSPSAARPSPATWLTLTPTRTTTADTEVILDGYFHESEMRSAPYFDLQYRRHHSARRGILNITIPIRQPRLPFRGCRSSLYCEGQRSSPPAALPFAVLFDFIQHYII